MVLKAVEKDSARDRRKEKNRSYKLGIEQIKNRRIHCGIFFSDLSIEICIFYQQSFNANFDFLTIISNLLDSISMITTTHLFHDGSINSLCWYPQSFREALSKQLNQSKGHDWLQHYTDRKMRNVFNQFNPISRCIHDVPNSPNFIIGTKRRRIPYGIITQHPIAPCLFETENNKKRLMPACDQRHWHCRLVTKNYTKCCLKGLGIVNN